MGRAMADRNRDARDRQTQNQREHDDYTEPIFKNCLNDPSWRKDAKPEDANAMLALLQAIEKRKYGIVITNNLPDLTPLWIEDIHKWGATGNPPSEDYKLIVKAMLLMKYGESALKEIALDWQKNGAVRTESSNLKTWQDLVDDMLVNNMPATHAKDPLLSAATPPVGVSTARTSPITSPKSADAVPNTVSSGESKTSPATSNTTTPTSLYYNGNANQATSTYLGQLSSNRYNPDSASSVYGTYGNPYGNTLTNPYGSYGSKYSSTSWSNPYANDAPRIYAQDGTYLGKLSTNPYDEDSISNPYGVYGNPYGNNLMNPYSTYGSQYSSQSWTNPYTTTAPGVYGSSPYSSNYILPKLPSLRD